MPVRLLCTLLLRAACGDSQPPSGGTTGSTALSRRRHGGPLAIGTQQSVQNGLGLRSFIKRYHFTGTSTDTSQALQHEHLWRRGHGIASHKQHLHAVSPNVGRCLSGGVTLLGLIATGTAVALLASYDPDSLTTRAVPPTR